jgi:hypothetical protein
MHCRAIDEWQAEKTEPDCLWMFSKPLNGEFKKMSMYEICEEASQ